nr:g20.3 [Escherichia coli]
MKYQLTALEARVIGCLLEKQVTTPEQYPLSVNGVVTACNQKTNREPVMNLSESEVQEQLDNLVKRHYLRTVSGFGNRVTKYEQRFCNSEFGDLKLSAAEVALITTLLLRVPRRQVNCAAAPRECMNSAIWRKWSRRWNNWQIAKMVLLWCVWPANRVNAKTATCIFSVVRLKISRR